MLDDPGPIQKLLNEIFGNQHVRPNSFTIEMGKLIRQAREEKGYSQSTLATKIGMRRATLSEIENGKNEPNASELTYLAAHLAKPLTFFFPKRLRSQITQEDLSPEELELLSHFRELWDTSIMKVGIGLIKSLSEYDPTETLRDNIDLTLEQHERDKALAEFINRKKKK